MNRDLYLLFGSNIKRSGIPLLDFKKLILAAKPMDNLTPDKSEVKITSG